MPCPILGKLMVEPGFELRQPRYKFSALFTTQAVGRPLLPLPREPIQPCHCLPESRVHTGEAERAPPFVRLLCLTAPQDADRQAAREGGLPAGSPHD